MMILSFANGGDRNKGNIPEMSVDGIDFIFSVGGDDKKNSSSWILKNGNITLKRPTEFGALSIIYLRRMM